MAEYAGGGTFEMNCKERTAAIVEYARRRAEPDTELSAHLAGCSSCGERWETEQQLTSQFRVMRIRASARRVPDARRESLLREFARRNRRQPMPVWAWALSAAAVLLFAALLGHNTRSRVHVNSVPAIRTRGVRTTPTILYEASTDAAAISDDDDFIALPYAPPLAAGELVRVVHADLDPDVLASMGIDMDPSWSSDLSADVVVGEDGLPRALRIADNTQF
jgi:predicted anti-sigma-YlaC factor YlaD